jgi:hypothetical protein
MFGKRNIAVQTEEQALRSKRNGPVAWSAVQAGAVEQAPVTAATGESSTRHNIEAARLRVFAPPGLLLDLVANSGSLL